LSKSAIDKDLPVFNVRTMAQAMNASVAPRRFTLSLVGLFAVLALALTAVGIYGMLSYSVSQRTRELGIRMALGASRQAVLRLMLGQGMRLALGGIGLGLAGSLPLTRLIQSQLFEISGSDPLTLITVAMLLAAVAAFACWRPARRAAQADPMVALRAE
jgi:putative ABC transport system permease protein